MTYEEVLDKEFPHLKGSVYIDYAGAMPLCQSQTACLAEITSNCLGNTHSKGHLSIPSNEIENLRSELCNMFGTNPGVYAVAFLENTSHAMKVLSDLISFDKTWSFAYLRDNHNSAFGMRVGAEKNGAKVMTTTDFPNDQEERENNFFLFPYMSNFSGRKYPLKWVSEYQKKGKNHYVLLDSASGIVPQLGDEKPDFICGSLLKITGMHGGFLMIRRDRAPMLKSPTPAGGTVLYTCANSGAYQLLPQIQKQLEQGTPQYINLMLALAGIRVRKQLGGEQAILDHIDKIGKRFEEGLLALKHSNGKPLIKFMPERTEGFGGNFSFNMFTADGKLINHNDVNYCFTVHSIVARTGIHCNPGGMSSLGWDDAEIEEKGKEKASSGECLGSSCVIDERPVGTVRLTLGVASRMEDVETVLKVLHDQFIDNGPCPPLPEKIKTPLTVQRIFLYPILGALGFEVKEWEFDDRGLKFDRKWKLVTADGVVINLNANLNLASLITSIEDMKYLVLTFNGEQLKLPIEGFEENKNAPENVLSQGKVYSDAVSQWLFNKLGAYYYLVKTENRESGRMSFSCANEASVKEIGEDFDVKRLRVNIVFNGCEAFAEQGPLVGNYKLAGVNVTKSKPRVLCVMTTIVPFTKKLDPEPLKRLSAKRGRNGIVQFGFLFGVDCEGKIAKLSVGDKFEEN